jgi:hypothetical protein
VKRASEVSGTGEADEAGEADERKQNKDFLLIFIHHVRPSVCPSK